MILKKEIGFTFDDVLIEPGYSDLDSRSEVSLNCDLFGIQRTLPIISSNMDYITGPVMAEAMWNAGGLGILHRFAPNDERLDWIDYLGSKNIPVFMAVGVRNYTDILAWVDDLRFSTYKPHSICIDVAHGHMDKVGKMINAIKALNADIFVIAGNVATAEGFKFLSKAGADAIKVGIGPGAVCTTRVVAGVGVPQLSAIMECAEVDSNAKLIADGGIRTSGDIVKALAAGADFVMLGHMLSGATETPGPSVDIGNGRTYRPYRGQSTLGVNSTIYAKEGVAGLVEEKGPVGNILHQLAGGIRSGMSYVGARNISELQEFAVFRPVSSASVIESSPRISKVM
jgi:IMP dehydrogenase